MAEHADYVRLRECPGGGTDVAYYGLATGLCPVCGEFVPLLSDGQTIRHYGPFR